MKPVPSHSASPRALRRSLLIAGVALPALAAHAAEAASPVRGPAIAMLGQTDRVIWKRGPDVLTYQYG